MDPEHAQYRRKFKIEHGNILDDAGSDLGPLNEPFNNTEMTDALIKQERCSIGR